MISQIRKIICIGLGVMAVTVIVLLIVFWDKNAPSQPIVDQIYSREYSQKISDLENMLKKNPQDPDIIRDLAWFTYLSGDVISSRALLQKAISFNDHNPQYYIDLGALDEKEDDITSAETEYKKAIMIASENASKERDNTMTLIQKNITLPDNMDYGSMGGEVYVMPYVALARLYLTPAVNKPYDAIEVLKDGIQIDDTYPDFYFMLAAAYENIGDLENARIYRERFDEMNKINQAD